jgi:hypothetical protein
VGLSLKIRGQAFTLTPKITEEGHKLKLTVALMNGQPAPRPPPRVLLAPPPNR